MTANLRLHYAPDNASLCVRLLLEELSVPFETILVDRSRNAQKSPAFLKRNPNGQIPVLETENGAVFETAAIMLWLADRYRRCIAAPSAPDRAHDLQWLFWLSNTLHAALRLAFYPEQHIAVEPDALRQNARDRIARMMNLLEHADNAHWLDRAEPTVHSFYLAPMLRWAAIYTGQTGALELTHFPRLHNFARRVESRVAVQTVATAEGLGALPFSAPRLPHPPEGSAT